jgi:hypothetical protein
MADSARMKFTFVFFFLVFNYYLIVIILDQCEILCCNIIFVADLFHSSVPAQTRMPNPSGSNQHGHKECTPIFFILQCYDSEVGNVTGIENPGVSRRIQLGLGNGTGHPRGVQTLTRTLTRAGFDPKHPGSKHKKTRKTVKKRVF